MRRYQAASASYAAVPAGVFTAANGNVYGGGGSTGHAESTAGSSHGAQIADLDGLEAFL